jgi:hypothetical protein
MHRCGACGCQWNILLVQQYRQAVDKERWRSLSGIIGSFETAVKREMQEETGQLPAAIGRMGGFYSAPGFYEYLYLYQQRT